MQSEVDTPLFLGREVDLMVPELRDIDRAGLLDEDACQVPSMSISGPKDAARAEVEVGAIDGEKTHS